MPLESLSSVRIRIIQFFALLGALAVAGALISLHVVESDEARGTGTETAPE